MLANARETRAMGNISFTISPPQATTKLLTRVQWVAQLLERPGFVGISRSHASALDWGTFDEVSKRLAMILATGAVFRIMPQKPPTGLRPNVRRILDGFRSPCRNEIWGFGL